MILGNTTCPHCGRENNMHAETFDTKTGPEDGDVSICWKCHEVSFFASDRPGGLRKPETPQEIWNATMEPQIQQAIHAMRESYTPTQAAALTKPMPIEFNG